MLGYVVCILHNCSFVLLRGSLFGIHLFTKRKQAQRLKAGKRKQLSYDKPRERKLNS
jgi:hypothetical protein